MEDVLDTYQGTYNPEELFVDYLGPEVLFDSPYDYSFRDTTPHADRAFQKRISEFSVLTADEEIALSLTIQAARNEANLNAHVKVDNSKWEPLSAEGEAARLELFEKNLRLASWVARMTMNLPNQTQEASADPTTRVYRGVFLGNLASLSGWPMPLEERIQTANIGLMRAVNKFKVNINASGKPTKFSTFAMYEIENALIRGILNYGAKSGARLPDHIGTSIRAIENADSYIRAKGQVPTDELIACDIAATSKLKLSVGDISDLRTLHYYYHNSLSLDDDSIGSLDGSCEDFDEDVPAQAFETLLTDDFQRIFKTLSEREAGVMELRWGLFGADRPHTLDEIGAVFGVTRERIRQIESKAMTKLRHPYRSNVLQGYLYGEDSVRRPQRKVVDDETYEEIVISQRKSEISVREQEREDAKGAYAEVISAFFAVPSELYFTDGVLEPYEAKDRLLRAIEKTLPSQTTGKHLEAFWNQRLQPLIANSTGPDNFAYKRFNLVFADLLNKYMKPDDKLTLNIPEQYSDEMDSVANGLTHGSLTINGNVADSFCRSMTGTAKVLLNGNAGNFAGAYMGERAALRINGNVGNSLGYYVSDTASIIVTGNAGPSLGRAATDGLVFVEGAEK